MNYSDQDVLVHNWPTDQDRQLNLLGLEVDPWLCRLVLECFQF